MCRTFCQLNSLNESTQISPNKVHKIPLYVGVTTVTGLSSRTFAVWSLLSGIVRIYAAYDVHNPMYVSTPCIVFRAHRRLYNLTLWTFGLAWIHFASEWTVYRTAGIGPGLLSPVIVSSTYLPCLVHQLTHSNITNLDDHSERLLSGQLEYICNRNLFTHNTITIAT